MSNGYRDGAFALGLVVGGGLALNLFLWLDYKAKYEGDQPTSGDSGANSSEIGGFWDQLIGTFVSPSDTLAQWIMAIFTVAVVVLVWKTLVATQDMATDQRRIGEAQVRAYLSIVEFSFSFDETRSHPVIKIKVRNSGQSPARKIEVVVRFSFFPVVKDHFPPRHEDQTGVMWLNDAPAGMDTGGGPTTLVDARIDKGILGDNLEGLSGVHLDAAVYAFDVFESEVFAYGHYAVSWGIGEDRRIEKAAHDMSSVMPGDLFARELRRKERPKKG